MIFSIGMFLSVVGYFWYVGTEFHNDWRDTAQLAMRVIGGLMVMVSLCILSWKYLP